ncbi:MAG: ImmA/IrrE family metallo-endopeptidase [Actinomycetales bacterium]
MITWEQANRRAGVLASELHGELDLELDRPIDVFHAIQRLDLVLAFADLEATSGVYLPARSGGALAGILVHQGHPLTRQRYTAAHELGHHRFNHGDEVDGDIESMRREHFDTMTDQEKEAEAFAAWFLMPRRVVRAGMKALDLALSGPGDAYALSTWLGTSYTATVRHLPAIRMLDPAMAGQWAMLRPLDLKAELSGQIAWGNSRSDVVALADTHNVQTVNVRPGDRMLLQLEEAASTGYTWAAEEMPSGVEVLADSEAGQWTPRFLSSPGDDSRRDAQVPGIGQRRGLLIGLSEDLGSAAPTILRLGFKLERPWSGAVTRAMEVLVAVEPRRHGLQEPEDLLRLDA